MSTVAAPEHLLVMADREGVEMVEGRLVERNVSALASWIGGEVFGRLADHVEGRDMGTVWPPGNGIRCFLDDPSRVRRPSVTFVAKDRFSTEDLSAGRSFLTLAPDLVVEVISTNDLAKDVERKVKEYLGAGVRLIWVIDPETRTIRIHRGDGSAARLRQGGELSGEGVVPGFRCPVRDLFPPAKPAVAR